MATDSPDQPPSRRPAHQTARSINSRTLLRRLIRLDAAVVADAEDGAGRVVRATSGATVTIRRGRWSPRQIEALLDALAVPTADFDDTR